MRKAAETWAKSRKIEERLIAAVESMKAAEKVQESVGVGSEGRGSVRKQRRSENERERDRGGQQVRFASGGGRRKSWKSGGGLQS